MKKRHSQTLFGLMAAILVIASAAYFSALQAIPLIDVARC
jgi:hypothetical protein